MRPNRPRRVPLNFFVAGANSDMPQERIKGVPAIELSNFDTSPSTPGGRSLLQAKDGFTPLNMRPAQSNPDGQASNGGCTLKAYTFPGVRGNLFAVVANGATGASVQNGNAGEYRMVYQSLSGTTPSVEYGSQNTQGPAGYLISQNILVRATYSATPSPQLTFVYLDKTTLAASSEVYSVSGTASTPRIMCSDGAGSQFIRALFPDSGESNKDKPSFYGAYTQDDPPTFENIGNSSFTWGYASDPPEISSWFAKTAGTGITASYTGYGDSASGQYRNGRIFQVAPSSQSNAVAITPVDATQLRTSFYAIAEAPDSAIVSISIQPAIIGFSSLVFTAGEWVVGSSFFWTPNPASSSLPTFFAESFQRGPDLNYYAVLYTGNSASPSTQPRSLVKFSPSFGGGGTITSLPTPTVVHTFSEVYASASLAILPDGRMCVVGSYSIGGGVLDYEVSFFEADGTLVTTLEFPSHATDFYIAPTMVSPWLNDQFLVVGVRRTRSGSTLLYSPWGAYYNAEGSLVMQNDNTSPFFNANVPTGGGMFDPLGINSSIPL